MKYLINLCLILLPLIGGAQEEPKLLMQDELLQIEATEAVLHMYNFKFNDAEVKFKELIARLPEHPLPYYLMGLSNWWKMMPYSSEDPAMLKYQPNFDYYMELSISKAEKIYKKNENDIEATFFLCAAHALIARHYAENGQEMRSLNNARKTFSYFKKLNDNNELSPEFLFGSALFNYYAAWFREEYPALKPILALFPKGDKVLGIKQLKEVAYNSFWTRTEAQYFLMSIYYNEEDDERSALPMAEYLAKTYPDNPYFNRIYARITYTLGKWHDCKRVSEDILYKISIGMPGYEENAGRYASYFLGKISKTSGNIPQAKLYYEKAILFAEKSGATEQNYYLYSLNDLAKIADSEKNIPLARQYCVKIVDSANKDSPIRNEAKLYLEKTEEKKEKSKGWLW